MRGGGLRIQESVEANEISYCKPSGRLCVRPLRFLGSFGGKESVGPELPLTVGAQRRSPADPTISGLTEEPEPELGNSNLAIARTKPLLFQFLAY